jgi:hypothetical protein
MAEFGLYMLFYMTYMINFALRLPSVHLGRSTTADVPHNPGMLLIPALPSPVGGHHTSPISRDPMVGPSRSTDPIYTTVADFCEIGSNTFAAFDGCRVDICRCKLIAGASWGFRTVSESNRQCYQTDVRRCDLV